MYIRSIIPSGKLLRAQYVYSKGWSVDTDLMHNKFRVGTFLEIDNAFKNVQPEVVVKAHNKLEVESNLKHLTYSLVCDEMVVAKW